MKGPFVLFVLCLLPLAFHYSGRVSGRSQPGLSLEDTFNLYVRAVQNSDLEGLFSTVTDSEDFFFLTADGRMLDRDEYYNFHQEWFKVTDWEMPVKLLKVRHGKDYGYTEAIFYYKEKTPDGRTYNLESYFTLIFRREDGMWKVVADVCTPIKRYLSEPGGEISYDVDQERFFEIIKTRRTVRKYKPDPVPSEHIRKILDAARFAPTAGNVQPWKFVVIQDRKRLDSLGELLKKSWEEKITASENLDDKKKKSYIEGGKEAIDGVMTAPVYVMVFVDTTTFPKYAAWDGCLAVENLMLAARSLGYGTGFFTSYFPEDLIKSFVKAPDDLRFICATPIGIPEKWPETPEKKNLEEFITYESFDKE
jgi:nitroreductase/ketosteroid isomerase-like protein